MPPREEQIKRADQAADPAAPRADAAVVLGRLIRAAQALLAGLPHAPLTAAQVSSTLDLQRKVAWQLCRVAESEHVLAAANFVPGPKPMRTLLERARAAGVAGSAVDELAAAFEEFERFVRDAAGDRATLITMFGAAARDPSATASADRQHRVSIFKSFSHFYGMSVDVVSDLLLLHETAAGERTEVNVRKVGGVNRLKADAHPIVERHRLTIDASAQDHGLSPLDAQAFRQHGVPVLPAFSSDPLPTLVFDHDRADHISRVQWSNPKIGPGSPIDLTLGVVRRVKVPLPDDDNEHGLSETTMIGYPVRAWRKTWLVRIEGRRLLTPRLSAYLSPAALLSTTDRETMQPLSLTESIECFPAGSWSKMPARFGGVREQVAYVCGLMRWNPADFHVFELHMEFPLLHSVLVSNVPWKRV